MENIRPVREIRVPKPPLSGPMDRFRLIEIIQADTFPVKPYAESLPHPRYLPPFKDQTHHDRLMHLLQDRIR